MVKWWIVKQSIESCTFGSESDPMYYSFSLVVGSSRFQIARVDVIATFSVASAYFMLV